MIITKFCNPKVLHELITYEEFVRSFELNNLECIDFTNSKIQKYYIFYSKTKNHDIDNPTIYKNFFNLTKEKLLYLNLKFRK